MVGVLALQGDVREHACGLARAGEPFRAVKSPEHLAGLDGIILPGGESTALRRLIASSGLTAPLANLLARGLPVWGTCAGVILLCRGGVWPVIDATLQRNAYGPQLASSVRRCLTVLSEHPFPMVFIRAPRLIRVGPDVEVLAWTARWWPAARGIPF